MASLTGLQINNTYPGLIKTTDNAAIDGAPRILTDGEGNALPIQVSTAGTDFNGNVDFAAATVTGLPAAGVTSIIAGTGISIDQATGAVTVTNNIVDYNTTYDLAAAANGAAASATATRLTPPFAPTVQCGRRAACQSEDEQVHPHDWYHHRQTSA